MTHPSVTVVEDDSGPPATEFSEEQVRDDNPLPNSTFNLPTAVLVVTTSALASVPPAVAAANRDLARILRIP